MLSDQSAMQKIHRQRNHNLSARMIHTMIKIGFSDPTLVNDEEEDELVQTILTNVTLDNADADDLIPKSVLSPNNTFLFFVQQVC